MMSINRSGVRVRMRRTLKLKHDIYIFDIAFVAVEDTHSKNKSPFFLTASV